jgi:hypothetical protein
VRLCWFMPITSSVHAHNIHAHNILSAEVPRTKP